MLKTLERRLRATLNDTRRTAAERFFVDRQSGLWRSELSRLGVRSRDHARIVAIVDETPDTRTFVLEPPRGWAPHLPGQWTRVEVELDGVRTSRCYSLSSAPHDPELRVTVKRVPDGRVSGHLHGLRVGDSLRIAPAEGAFVLPSRVFGVSQKEVPWAPTPSPAKVLLLSGGSGITPMRAMWRVLAESEVQSDVVIVHHARSAADVAFAAELAALSQRAGFRVVLRLDDDPNGTRGFDEEALRAAVPDLAERETFLCGPPAMMRRVEAMELPRLHVERFTAAPRPTPDPDAKTVLVSLVRLGRSVSARTDGTLLDQLEAAGERPPSGCRMGLCRTCTCLKRSGTVRHAITGAISDSPDETIQLCVSVPCTDVELGL